MNHLERIETAAKDLIRYYAPEYTFVWDRSLRRKGQCRVNVRQIGISKPLAKINTFECMLLTVIHEIAHALLPREHHSRAWSKLCIELGGDGQATYSSNEVKTPARWVLYNGDMPTVYKRFRRWRVSYPYNWRKEVTK